VVAASPPVQEASATNAQGTNVKVRSVFFEPSRVERSRMTISFCSVSPAVSDASHCFLFVSRQAASFFRGHDERSSAWE
jgi:hypothetical protein